MCGFSFIAVSCRIELDLSAFLQMMIVNTPVFGGLVLEGCVTEGITIA